MSKTFVFPTDFTVSSLAPVQAFLDEHPGERPDIVLICGAYLSDSITELLFFSRHALLQRFTSTEFEAACAQLLKQYAGRIHSFRTELFTGQTQSAFDNFLSGLRAVRIYVPGAELSYGRQNLDLSGYIANCSIEVVRSTSEKTAETGAIVSRIRFAK